MSSESSPKRVLPPWLTSLLDQDKRLTKSVCEAFDKKYGLVKYRPTFKYLEVSCHGIPWLGGAFAMLYFYPEGAHLWMNLLCLLVVDIVIVAVLKAITRRRRPTMNESDMFATISVDKFSFPSGHATRAVSLAAFFTRLYPLPMVLAPPLLMWSASVCASRVLLGRHHVLDVTGGVIVGLAEAALMAVLWMGEERAVSLAEYFFGDDPWSNA